jgi:phage tail-like protein
MDRDQIKTFLPSVFQRTDQRGNLLAAMLDVMEILHAPAEEVIENIDQYFDARRTPDDFVLLLAQWVNLDRIFPSNVIELGSPTMPEIGRLRELIANATYLSKWRGTKKGLLLFLQMATGAVDFEIDERVKDDNGQIKPFHLGIRAPQPAEPQADLIRRIIESEKPAHTTYELTFS